MRQALALLAALAALDAIAGLTGFAIFALLFKLGLFAGVTMLFFRGLVLAALACLLTALLMLTLVRRGGFGLGARDAVNGAILSLAFNIAFLVVVPVTVDRSISVFILGAMNEQPTHVFSADEMSRLFTRVYVEDYREIDRRLVEQTATGNVEAEGTGYRISPRGRLFIRMSRGVSWLFGGDRRLADPPAALAPHPSSRQAD